MVVDFSTVLIVPWWYQGTSRVSSPTPAVVPFVGTVLRCGNTLFIQLNTVLEVTLGGVVFVPQDVQHGRCHHPRKGVGRVATQVSRCTGRRITSEVAVEPRLARVVSSPELVKVDTLTGSTKRVVSAKQRCQTLDVCPTTSRP